MNTPPKSIWWRWGLGLTLGSVFLYLSLRDVPLAESWDALRRADVGWVLLALGGVALNNAAKVWRWQILLAERRQHVPFGLALRAILAGQMFNYLLPMRAGDLSRAYLVGIQQTGTVYALGTIALEKVLDTLMYALLFVLTALALPLPAWVDNSGFTLTVLSLAMGLGAWLLARYSAPALAFLLRIAKILPPRWAHNLETRLRDALRTLRIIRSGRALTALGLWSLIVWGSAIFPNWALLRALSLPGGWSAAAAVLVFLQAVISLPGVPGRVGVFQYACILALALFGVAEAPAFSYGLLLQAVAVLPLIAGGVVSLGHLRWRPLSQE